ncbi:hypothetical protein [Algoriphagus mannitolivorans]|uniref:hypothetical protein n=1 Tax=Algoriphagus mannitolivorans TaxID=226504 RepID=UPI0003F6BD72|nr:hypothetical protein [Algoriphagus mannitolivorans]
MKTLFTFAIASALTLSSLAANASDDLKSNSEVKANFKKVNVLLKEGVGQAKVAILDPNGKKLHQRKVNVTGQDVVIPYNLKDLPCGEYTVRIITEDEKVEYSVETFEKTETPASPLVAYAKEIEGNAINLTVVGLEEPGVEVTLRYAESGRVMLREDIFQPAGFQKNYRLVGVSAEDVYVELKDAKGRSKTLYFE